MSRRRTARDKGEGHEKESHLDHRRPGRRGGHLGLTVPNGKGGKVEYRTEAIGKGDIEALVVTSGTLNPIEIVDVGAQVSGKIEKLYADFNSPVTRGQIVAELDQEPLKMKIDQNEANFKSRMASLGGRKWPVPGRKKAGTGPSS
jgi:HlyD family secretion protein